MAEKPPWLRNVRGEQVLPLITNDAGVLRVQAGPGTGKTFGLRKRVLRLLHPDGDAVDQADVLVCSFNRVIAKDLLEEITAELAPYGLGIPRVTTVHSLCASIVGAAPRFLLPHEIELMTFDILEEHASLKTRFNTQPKALRALREHEAGAEDHPDLMAAVKQWLADHKGSLVGDVIRKVRGGLDAGDYESGMYGHVIVDEFQDLTAAEADILVQLRSDDGQLVALGDRKQSIYAFRGNDERGLDALPDLVNDPVVDMPMDECERCHREVVDLANAVMALEGEPLVDIHGPGTEIHHIHFEIPSEEAQGIATEVVRVYKERPEDEHLVLVTRRRWGYDVRNAIRELDPAAPVETSFAEDVLETWPAREAFILLEIIGAPDPISLRDWVGYQKPTDGKNFKAPQRNARAYLPLKKDFGVLTRERVEGLKDEPSTSFRGSGKSKLLYRLERLRQQLHDVPDTDDLAVVVQHVLDPDRWIDFTGDHASLAREDLERLRVEAERLLEEMKEPSLRKLVTQLRYRIATREPLGGSENEGVRVVTLWGAKGLTADFVYIVGLVDEALPGPHNPDSTGQSASEHLAEQRRLLYVSLTRAKQALVISRPKKIRSGEVKSLGLTFADDGAYWQKLHRTRFFDDLPAGVLPTAVAGATWKGINLG